jgi:hypothetical protein
MTTREWIAYSGKDIARPRYYANQHHLDLLDMAPREMPMEAARGIETDLDREGFVLIQHHSAVRDWMDRSQVDEIHRPEISAVINEMTGADEVLVISPGILRFSEKSALSGERNNSRPARFAHVDISGSTASSMAARANPTDRPIVRFVHFNIWRVLSAPPQDVPLALCDARTVDPSDLIPADAIFDAPGQPEWSFEGLVVAHNPKHRWCWFPDMTEGEAIVFKTHDNDPTRACCVPHVAFDHRACDPAAEPRISIEMRALALWYR